MTNKQTIDGVSREHRLKIHKTPYLDLLSGAKTCEVRDCSDRDFKVGDSVVLMLVDETGNPTPNELRRKITHIQTGYGLQDHLCVLSYEPVNHHRDISMSFEQTRDGIADFLADNMPIKKYTLAEIERMIREVSPTPTSRAEPDQ